MRNLVLTGFMGTGKTTVARLLARRYGLELVDTDSEIERRAGCSVAEIFARDGESSFRELEAQVFRAALARPGSVIATGGGTLVSTANRNLLGPEETVVCLTCDLEALGRRIGPARDRPLFHADEPGSMRTLLREREPVYALYPQLDTTELEPHAVADAIAVMTSLDRAATFVLPQAQSSSVLFEEGLLARAGELVGAGGRIGQAFILTDSRVAGLRILSEVQQSLASANFEVVTHVIPEGEGHKTLETMMSVYDTAMSSRLDRSAVVIGLGGGVVGDMAGMLAATYLRGLRLILLPTTLLAQVDAAIGGKVGVDFHGAKNMIGAFKPAELVLIDPNVLTTLPAASLADGLAEIIKIGFMRSERLVSQLESIRLEGLLDATHIIRTAAELKVDVVQRDPLERDERMLLNFGHTIGHGLEAAGGYRLSHGRAVSIGMVTETRLASARGWCDESTLHRLVSILERFDLPTDPDETDRESVLRFVGQDKKRQGEAIRLAIPRSVGVGEVMDVSLDDVRAVLTERERV